MKSIINRTDERVRLILSIITCLCIILSTKKNSLESVLETIFISLNIFIRLNFTSSYSPLTQNSKEFYYSPYLARTLATISEFIIYSKQTKILGIEFWDNIPAYITTLGESLSWFTVLTGNGMFGWIEDLTWGILEYYLFYVSTNNLKYYIALPHVLYTFFYHLPQKEFKFKQIEFKSPAVEKTSEGNLIWQTDSLISQGIGLTLFRYIE